MSLVPLVHLGFFSATAAQVRFLSLEEDQKASQRTRQRRLLRCVFSSEGASATTKALFCRRLIDCFLCSFLSLFAYVQDDIYSSEGPCLQYSHQLASIYNCYYCTFRRVFSKLLLSASVAQRPPGMDLAAPPPPNEPPGPGRMAYYRGQNPVISGLEVILGRPIYPAIRTMMALFNQHDIDSLRSASPRWLGGLPDIPKDQIGPACDEHMKRYPESNPLHRTYSCGTNAQSRVALRRCDNDRDPAHKNRGNHHVCQDCHDDNAAASAINLQRFMQKNLVSVCDPCRDLVLDEIPRWQVCVCQTWVDMRTPAWGCDDCCWPPIEKIRQDGDRRRENLYYTQKDSLGVVTVDRDSPYARRKYPACPSCCSRDQNWLQKVVLMCVVCNGYDVERGRTNMQ